jgi:hypothetical protein
MREFTEGQFEIMIASYMDFRSLSTGTVTSENAQDSDVGNSIVATDGESDNGASNAGASIDVTSTEAVSETDVDTTVPVDSSSSAGSSVPSVSPSAGPSAAEPAAGPSAGPSAEPSAEPSLDTGASSSKIDGSTPLLAALETTSDVDESETDETTLSANSFVAGSGSGFTFSGLFQYGGSSMFNNAAAPSGCSLIKSGANCKVDFQCCSRACVGSNPWTKTCR